MPRRDRGDSVDGGSVRGTSGEDRRGRPFERCRHVKASPGCPCTLTRPAASCGPPKGCGEQEPSQGSQWGRQQVPTANCNLLSPPRTLSPDVSNCFLKVKRPRGDAEQPALPDKRRCECGRNARLRPAALSGSPPLEQNFPPHNKSSEEEEEELKTRMRLQQLEAGVFFHFKVTNRKKCVENVAKFCFCPKMLSSFIFVLFPNI